MNVNSISFNNNESILASGSKDRTTKIWKYEINSKTETTLQGHNGFVNSIALNNNGTILASGLSDGTIKLWKVIT